MPAELAWRKRAKKGTREKTEMNLDLGERAFCKRLSVEGKRFEMLAPAVQATTIAFSVPRVLMGVNGSRN